MKQPITLSKALQTAAKQNASPENRQPSAPSTSSLTKHVPSNSLPAEARMLLTSFPDPKALLLAYNPQATTAFCAHYSALQPSGDTLPILGRIYAIDAEMYRRFLPAASQARHPAPTLAAVSSAYQPETAIAWLVAQLHSLAEYAGVKDKFTQSQLQEQASLILSEYYFLRLSEFMDFFRLFKLGKFGKFYGNADPLVVTEALRKFLDHRAKVIDRLIAQRKEEEAAREREERTREAITFEQYQQLLKQQGKKPESFELIKSITNS